MDLAQLVSGALETAALAAGIEATYHRGNVTVSLTVIPARTEQRIEPRQAIGLRGDRHDFLIRAADLVIDSERTTPTRGDYLTMTRNGQDCRYDVVEDTGEMFRLDQTEACLRVHTLARTRT